MNIVKRIRAYVSGSPLAHVVIAAFIGAALPPLVPLVIHGTVSFVILKMAVSAGLSAALRAAVLLVPGGTTSSPNPPVAP